MTDAQDRRVVADGKIRHLAVRAIQMFNPLEEGCPLRWWYRYVQGRKEPQRKWHEEGDAVDQQITHFLTFNQPVLGKVARAGEHLLPTPGTDLLLQWGLNDKPRPRDEHGKPKSYYPPEEAKVFAAGIPLIGFTDIINGREEYLVPTNEHGDECEMRREPGVVEVLDIKTAKKFKYTKSHEALGFDTQLLGYSKLVSTMETSITAVRDSHLVFLTEGSPKAIKRSTLLPIATVNERWSKVDAVAEQMKCVAGTRRPDDVKGNLEVCNSFGGCPHKPYCSTYQKTTPLKRSQMGLLKGRQTPPNGAAPASQTPAAVAAAPQLPPPPQQTAPPSNTPWQQAPQVTQPSYTVAPAQTMAPPAPPAQMAPPPPPPAAPPPPPPAAAAPVAPVAPAPQGPPEGKWILARDAQQGFTYVLPPQNALAMYLVSSNGKQSFLPMSNGRPGGAPIVKEYNDQVYEIANSRVPDAPLAVVGSGQSQQPAPQQQQQQQAAPQAPAAEAPAAPKKRARKQLQTDPSTTPAPSSTPSSEEFVLCVNTVPNGPYVDLNNYAAELLGEMQQQFQVPDVRAVMDDRSPLAFGRWKGVLAALTKENLPPPGTYVAFTRGSETIEVITEALATLCTGPGQLWRGV